MSQLDEVRQVPASSHGFRRICDEALELMHLSWSEQLATALSTFGVVNVHPSMWHGMAGIFEGAM